MTYYDKIEEIIASYIINSSTEANERIAEIARDISSILAEITELSSNVNTINANVRLIS